MIEEFILNNIPLILTSMVSLFIIGFTWFILPRILSPQEKDEGRNWLIIIVLLLSIPLFNIIVLMAIILFLIYIIIYNNYFDYE